MLRPAEHGFQMDTLSSNRIQKPPGAGVKPLASAMKALALLDHLATRRTSVRPAELAAELEEGRATIYQRLQTLVAAGWVEALPDGRYRLTLRAARLAKAAAEQAGLGDRAMQVLEALVAETRETASLAVLEDALPCIVQRVEPQGMLRAELRVGSTLTLHRSASGCVLVAFADAATLQRLRRGRAVLPDDAVLAAVRRAGHAVFDGQGMEDVRAAAVPVLDPDGRCVAALSLVGPVGRFDAAACVAPMRHAAQRLAQMLEGR
jgi:DNA-binding IclR family transcriptional regulator